MNPGRARLLRLRGLLKKEWLQIIRDPSSILLAFVMPMVLLFLFGYGISLDAENIPIAVLLDESTAMTRELSGRFEGSRYFQVVRPRSVQEAEELLSTRQVEGYLRVPEGFTEALVGGGNSQVHLILAGVESNRSRLVLGYSQAILGGFEQLAVVQGRIPPRGGLRAEPRVWFNEAVRSRNSLVPGLITLIMTIIGTLLTALVIAREWERGTMEALLVTPIRVVELLIGKLLPYYLLGLGGLLLTVGVAVTLFEVPFRGSLLTLLVLSSLFLSAALGLGLAISAALKVQFPAAQTAVIVGFLPALFLSGLLFDLESTPLPVQIISHVVPARYFVDISHTLFLAGDVWSVLWPNALALLLLSSLLLGVARSKLGKRLS